MKNVLIILASLIPLLFSVTASDSKEHLSCKAPGSIQVTAQTNNTVTYDWEDSSCSIVGYHVYYVKNGDTSSEWVTGNSNFTFTNLSTGTYHFYFYTEFVGGSASIIVEEMLDI